MALRTVTMAELRLEVLLEAEQSGESVAEICRRYKISPGDLLPVSTAVSRGRHRRPRGSVAAAEALTGADRRRAGGRDLSDAAEPSALGCASHPWRAERGGHRAAGGVDDPPSVAPQPSDRGSAAAPTQSAAAVRTRSDERSVADRRDRVASRRSAQGVRARRDRRPLALSARCDRCGWADRGGGVGLLRRSRVTLRAARQVLSDNGLCFTGRLHG